MHRRIGFKGFLAVIAASLLLVSLSAALVNAKNDKGHTPQAPDWWTGYSTAMPLVSVPEGYPPLPTHARYLGHLKGSWYEMGIQYGERAGDLMQLVFDGWYGAISKKMTWPEIIYRIHRYQDQTLKWYCPELLEFAQGMAHGAASSLEASQLHKISGITAYEMILALNLYFEINTAPPLVSGFPKLASSKTGSTPPAEGSLAGCSGIALLPKATAKGKLIHANSRDQSFWPQGYTVMYTLEHVGSHGPSGKPSLIYKVSSAGEIGGIQVGNDKGFTIGAFAGGNVGVRTNPLYPDYAFGVPWQFAMAQAGIFSSNMEEGIDNLVHGSKYYRKNTGRKIVQEAWGLNYMLSDRNSACTVEMNPYRYALRFPGDMGELGAAYIAQTNHNLCDYSYDEKDEKTNVPMTQFGNGYDSTKPSGLDGSGTRFWTIMGLAKTGFGRLDEHVLMNDLWTRDFYIDKAGNKIYYIWVQDNTTQPPGLIGPNTGWVPSHTATRTVSNAPGARSGQVDAHIAIPSELKFYWTLGTPPDWVGPWDSWSLEKGEHGMK